MALRSLCLVVLFWRFLFKSRILHSLVRGAFTLCQRAYSYTPINLVRYGIRYGFSLVEKLLVIAFILTTTSVSRYILIRYPDTLRPITRLIKNINGYAPPGKPVAAYAKPFRFQ